MLEVKDPHGMDWGIVRIPTENGRGGTYQHKPTKQQPFAHDNSEQGGDSAVLIDPGGDDLTLWLGQPWGR